MNTQVNAVEVSEVLNVEAAAQAFVDNMFKHAETSWVRETILKELIKVFGEDGMVYQNPSDVSERVKNMTVLSAVYDSEAYKSAMAEEMTANEQFPHLVENFTEEMNNTFINDLFVDGDLLCFKERALVEIKVTGERSRLDQAILNQKAVIEFLLREWK